MSYQALHFFCSFVIHYTMREKIKTGFSILIILILLPYVAVVFRTGSMNGLAVKKEDSGLEEYVAGILPGEIPVTYEEEALKAQAVVARTNLLYQSMEFYNVATAEEAAEQLQEKDLEKMGFVYYTPMDLEEFWGYEQWEIYQERVRKAVAETEGEFLTLDEKPIDLPYHAVSAGKTRSGAVLGAEYTYLTEVKCEGDLESPDYLRIEIFAEGVQGQAVSGNAVSEAEPEVLWQVPEILARDDSGYVTEVRMGEETLSGEEFRRKYGLNSSCFTVNETEGAVRITTKGLGHGLGMSLFQANLQALEGKTYREILSYFYRNVECISFR